MSAIYIHYVAFWGKYVRSKFDFLVFFMYVVTNIQHVHNTRVVTAIHWACGTGCRALLMMVVQFCIATSQKTRVGCNCISFHYIFAMTMFERMICRCCCMLHVIGEKKRGREEEKKKKKRRKKEEKIMYFLLILRPIFVGGACGGLYGRGALAPPHNPSDPRNQHLG